MRLSSRARYAVRLMVELDCHNAQRTPVNLKRIAQLTGISRRYLEQIAVALKNHSLLRGVSGRNGGYVLTRPAGKITVGEVLKAVSGPTTLSVCVAEPDTCMRAEFCSCRTFWSLLDRRIDNLLNEFSIADLSDKALLDDVRQSLLEGDEWTPSSSTGRLGRGQPATGQLTALSST